MHINSAFGKRRSEKFFHKTKILNGVQMYADNVTSFVMPAQIRSYSLLWFLLQKGKQNESTPFVFLNVEK